VLKVFQQDSYISVDYQNCEVRRYHWTTEGMSVDSISPDNKEPLKEELEDFIRCVKNRTRPRVSALEGREALKVVLEITEMIRRRNEKGC
jgi:predicted dehydrogenase